MDDKTKVVKKQNSNKRKNSKKKNGKSKAFIIFKRILITIIILAIISGIAALGYAYKVISAAPEINPNQLRPVETSFVYDDNDDQYANLHGEEDRRLVEYNEIPKHLIDAFIAIEDERYWDHPGIDLRAIMRAAYKTVTGQRLEGGSTITQQLLKNSILTPARTMERKLQEQWLAIQLERMYTKEEILQMYLNRVFLGHYAHGVQAASLMYFGKDVSELDLAESAMLAGLIQTPNPYSPYNNYDAALKRRNTVINKMLELEYITEEEATNAKESEIVTAGSSRKVSQPHPQYTWHAKEVAKDKLIEVGLAQDDTEADTLVFYGGLHIYTTLNRDMQTALEESVVDVMEGLGEEEADGTMGPQVAAMIIDPTTGEVKAAVGDRNVDKNGLKRYAQSPVTTGSSVKPVIDYAAAIERYGYTAGTVIDDAPVSFQSGSGVYRPQNYHKNFLGLVTVRTALVRSLNIPAVKTFLDVGIENAINFAYQLGINSQINPYPSSALGSTEMTLEEMVRAFGVFSNEGVLTAEQNNDGEWENTYIRKITDSDGNILYESNTLKKTVMQKDSAYIMTDILRDVVDRYSSTRSMEWQSAGKTGTSQGSQYTWFIGYTPDYVGGVWIGHDRYPYPPASGGNINIPISDRKWQERNRLTGSQWPATLWSTMMSNTLKAIEQPKNSFERPSNIVGPINISSKTGMLPGPYTPSEFVYEEIFVDGTEPTERDDFFKEVVICSDSSLLANENCPASSRVVRYRFTREEPYDTEDERGNTLDKPLDHIWEIPSEYCDVHLPGGAIVGEDGEIIYPEEPEEEEPGEDEPLDPEEPDEEEPTDETENPDDPTEDDEDDNPGGQ
ncbi:MAG: transglycosylase domain-containing protein [Clostridia bacterium]